MAPAHGERAINLCTSDFETMTEIRGTPVEALSESSDTRRQALGFPTDSLFPGENAVVWVLWLTYGSFYFCRQNLSAAVPGLKSAVSEGGLGLTGDQVGWILASLKIAYGLGQFANGQLAERIPPRIMLTVGMFGSAALNVLFGLSTGFYFLLFVWALNGFCQSLGWTPCVRVVANWVPIERRGRAIGIIGTGYQITLGLTFVAAGQAAEWFGWRGALYFPAVLLVLSGLFMLVFLRESPAHDSDAVRHAFRDSIPARRQLSITEALYWTLFNPTLWLLGITLGLLNACRYGYFDWGLTHLMEIREMPVGKAVLQYFVIAIGATAGSYLAGWATDRFFGGRRGPVICLLMAALGCLSLLYHAAVVSSAVQAMMLLVAIGFCIIGPQVLLVGTAPADLAHRGTSAAAAGFVNFMGYIGAATGDVVTGYYSAPEHGGWQVAIYIWAGWAFAGAAITAILWNTTSSKVGMLPSVVPRLAALGALGVSSVIALVGNLPMALTLATAAAALCVSGVTYTRWAALPGLLIASASVLFVFVSYAYGRVDATWHIRGLMVVYSLSIISTVMILVEQQEVGSCESL